MNNLHIITLNVQGWIDKNKRYRFYQWIKNQKCNIIFLQETHFTDKISKIVLNEISEFAEIFNSFGKSNSKGVSILVKNNLEYSVLKITSSDDGRKVNDIE